LCDKKVDPNLKTVRGYKHIDLQLDCIEFFSIKHTAKNKEID
jgi:hypothetical protein